MNVIKKFGFGILASLAFVGLNGLGAASASAETVLRFSNWLPPAHPLSKHLLGGWAKRVEKETNDSVKVEFFGGLGKPPGYFDLAKNGATDVAMIVHAYTQSRFNLTRASELPLMAKTATGASIALARTHDKFFKSAKEYAGVKMVGQWTTGPISLWMIKGKTAKTFEGISKLKIRVGGGMSNDVSKVLGITQFFAPAPKVYETLSRGVADGVTIDTNSILGFRLTRVIGSSLSVPGGLYRASMALVMNQKAWNGLSAGNKKALERASSSRDFGEVWDRLDRESVPVISKAGIKPVSVDAKFIEEFKKRVAPITQQWIAAANAKGVDGKKALSYFADQIKQLEK